MKYHLNPRMGINPLCEYVYLSSASRRSTIIKNAKEKPTFVVKRYNEAEDFLSYFLASKCDSKLLLEHIKSLRTGYYAKEFERDCAHYSADALEGFFRNGLWLTGLMENYDLEVSLNQTTHKIIISGVQISIRPELILYKKGTKERVGFLKLYISKTKPLESHHGELVACLGKSYFLEEHTLNFHSDCCLVLDVFRGELITAPKAFKKRMSDITASCKEIADRWDLVA
jgi:hypothetical protein